MPLASTDHIERTNSSPLEGGAAGGGGLLEHFRELTLHPKNAQELKGLILQLAIQGKLTAQWREEHPNVEPTSSLLKNFKSERAQLIEEKKIRKEQPLPPIEESEIQFDVPRSWVATRLGEIGDWGAGATPLRSRSEFYGGEINWFKSGELNNGIMDYDSEEKINELALKRSSLRFNKVGDVLIAMYGATIGKTGILAVEGTTNQAVCACTPFDGMFNRYLHLSLRALNQVFTSQGEGGAQPNISRVKIRLQPFLLPPLEEQKAIVATVNQLFAEVEQLEALTQQRIQLKEDFVASALHRLTTEDTASAWAFLQPHFHTFFTEQSSVKKLRESILQLAVQGKLTKHWRKQNPGVESAEELLARIKAEKAKLVKEGQLKKEKPLPAITEDEIPHDLPEGWLLVNLGELTELISGRDLTPSEYSEEVLEYPYLTGASQIQNGEIILSRWTHVPKVISKLGDLLVSVKGTVGKVVINEIGELHIARQIMALRSHDWIEIYYLRLFILSYVKELQEASNGIIPGISREHLLHAPIPLPPLEEQKAIVQQVNALMALCDKLENEIQTRETTLERWMQSWVRGVSEN